MDKKYIARKEYVDGEVNTNIAYGTCITAAATTEKAVSIANKPNWKLQPGSIVAIKFTNTVPAGSALNINDKGPKAIYHKGAAIDDGTIKASDTATFIYSDQYHLIAIDRDDYIHPIYPAKSSGLYKVTVDSTGHISSVEEVVKSDITDLGIPASDTNTHYISKNVVNSSSTSTSNTTTALANGNVYLISVENGAVTSAHKITGDGATTVTTDTSGNIVISSTDTKYTHPTTSGNKHIPSGGSSGQILRWSADGTAVWEADNNTTYSNFVKSGSGAKAGLVPAPSTTAGTTKYLREDGTWSVPPDTNTDTHYTTGLKVGASSTAIANAAATNGNVYLNALDNTTVRDSHKITGSGATTVTSDANGVITIASNDTIYTSLKNPYALTLQGNGTTLTDGTYDGSVAKTVNITPSSIGAAIGRVFTGGGTNGSTGYVAFAQLKITATYCDRPIEFELTRRGSDTPCYVSARFANTSSIDPTLESLTVFGTNYGVFAYKSTTSTWLLYAAKTDAYDVHCVVGRIDDGNTNTKVTITHPGTFISEKPSGAIGATYGYICGTSTKLSTSAGSATQPVYFESGKPVATTYTLGKSVPSDAVFTDTNTKVTSTEVNPSSATTYYPTLVTGATTETVSYNTDLNTIILQGTASAEGYAVLKLGNGKARGTAENKRGQINLYSSSTACSYLRQADITSAITHTFPATEGTILNSGTTSFTPSITSGTRTGVLKINDSSYDIYFTDTKVTQNNTTASSDYRLLMSGNANDTSQTVTTNKSSNFTANPSTGCLTAKMFKGEYATVYSGTIAASLGTMTISNLWSYSLLFVSIVNIDGSFAKLDRYPLAVQKLNASTSNSEVAYHYDKSGLYTTGRDSDGSFFTFEKSSIANSIDISASGISKIGMVKIEALL